MTYDEMAAKLETKDWDLDLTTSTIREAAVLLRRAAAVQRWATERRPVPLRGGWTADLCAECMHEPCQHYCQRAHVRRLLAGEEPTP